jgi:hypothetical protein
MCCITVLSASDLGHARTYSTPGAAADDEVDPRAGREHLPRATALSANPPLLRRGVGAGDLADTAMALLERELCGRELLASLTFASTETPLEYGFRLDPIAGPRSNSATLGLTMCCDGSDPLALVRAFSGVLARVNNWKLTSGWFPRISQPTNSPFAGSSRWAGQGSNLRPWD